MFEKQQKYLPKIVKRFKRSHWALFFITVLLLSVSLHPRLITRSFEIPAEGEVATRVIKAPRDFLVVDDVATRRKQDAALKMILPVYDYVPDQADKVMQKIENAFATGRDALISQALVKKSSLKGTSENFRNHLLDSKELIERDLGFPVEDSMYLQLAATEFSPTITELINREMSTLYQYQIVANVNAFENQLKNGIVLRNTQTMAEITETTHPDRVYALEHARILLSNQLRSNLRGYPDLPQNAILAFAQSALIPNLIENYQETVYRQQLAVNSVSQIMFEVKTNETIVRDGDRITPYQIKLLRALQEQENIWKDIFSTVGAFLLLSTLLLLLWLVYFRHIPVFRRDGARERNLLFLLSILIFFFFLTEFSAYLSDITADSTLTLPSSALAYGVPLASGAMLVCLFLGPAVAFAFAIVVSILAAMVFNTHTEIFAYTLIGSVAAGYWVTSCHERKKFIGIGVRLGLLNMAVALILSLYTYNLSFHKLLFDFIFAFCSGLGASIITLGLAPLIEVWFGFTTDVTLLELSNLDRPLLRRLMIEAPGTYHHSVIVGTMAESAATDIGANGLLAKVSGYYHDIGKIQKPLYFIENQMGENSNPHDKLNPSMSALVLIAHVKHGVEIAKEYKLSPAIIDAIQEHHGTSVIRYFYDKACRLKGEDAVSKNDFSYPGPKPQSKEAALLMLADVVEAASRTMMNPTPVRIQGLVQTLVNRIFTDGQLSECDLTLKDLHLIADQFTKVLTGIHHHRIEYADTAELTHSENGNGKELHGNLDRKPTKKNTDFTKKHSRKDPDAFTTSKDT